MKLKYNSIGYKTAGAKSWRLLASDVFRGVNLAGDAHDSEDAKVFRSNTSADLNKEAISTKKVSISFRSGEYQLDDNSKQIIDLQFTDIAKAFSNAKIRIEGNTDNVGARATNIALSQRRAQAVADYLIREHRMPRERFVITGNGPDKPVAGCETALDEGCKAKNRRTDFELIGD